MWLVLLIALLVPYFLLLLVYRYWWDKTPIQVLSDAPPVYHGFSVIVPARNEAENIAHCLRSILAQHYPENLFEVIVVDDFSTDATANIVRSFPQVRLLQLQTLMKDPINAYKKKAIETGIAAAKFPWIVTTDADCKVPPYWLAHLNQTLQQKDVVLVAAPVAMAVAHTPIQIFQTLDFMSLQGITAAAVNAGFHNMCNGANLCYSKQAFETVGGFRDIDHIASGDDMLLMHKIAQNFPAGIAYCKSPEAIVTTLPVNTVKDFLKQRIRWASKASHYEDKRIFGVLLLVYLLNAYLLLLMIVACFHHELWYLWLAGLLLKTMAELYFLIPVARFFERTKTLWWFPLAQPFHILYTVIAGGLGKWGTYEWKGRSVK